MLPVKALRLKLGTALAADATSLAPVANNNEVALVIQPFTPTEDLVVADLSLAAGDGLDPILAELGTQETGNDPTTGQQVITIVEPVGGWRFQLTGTPDPTVVVYGFALTTKDGVALLATALLPNQVSLAEIGYFIDLGTVTLTFVLEPIE
jgi:hypothetical protein